MKKNISLFLFILLTAAIMAVSAMAENYPTKFLGIPIDGPKEEMIRKIQEKGYTYDQEHDCLIGQFNGSAVHVYVGTNKGKVWRVMVSESTTFPEGEILIRFNNLLRQFQKNKKYIPLNGEDYRLPMDEDISYEMAVHHKIYSAEFFQITYEIDPVWLDSILIESMQMARDSTGVQLNIDSLNAEDRESLLVPMRKYFYLSAFEKNKVWFVIHSFYGKYHLTIYYDNGYNQADGEDL